jgi:multidrug resistance efflux pump
MLEAEREQARKALERDEELYKRLSLSTVALDESKVNFIQADGRVKAIKADLTMAKYNYEKSRLHAPISGRIIDRNAEAGQSIRAELQPPVLLRIADTTGFIVEPIRPSSSQARWLHQHVHSRNHRCTGCG